MATETFYGEDFRSIGQALEAKNIRAFELKRLGDWYIVRGVTDGDGPLRSKMHKLKLRFRSGSDPESLILGLSEVEDLSRKGKAKRSRPGGCQTFAGSRIPYARSAPISNPSGQSLSGSR